MLKKLFKNTKEKAEKAIDRTAQNVNEAVNDAKNLINQGNNKIKLITGLIILGIGVSIVTNIYSVAIGVKSAKMLEKSNINLNIRIKGPHD